MDKLATNRKSNETTACRIAMGLLGIYGATLLGMSISALLLGENMYHALEVFCHQLAERSFHIEHAKMGLCARCQGVYSGMLLGSAGYFLLYGKRNFNQLYALSFIAVAIFCIEFLLRQFYGTDTSNSFRWVIGLGLGLWLVGTIHWFWKR